MIDEDLELYNNPDWHLPWDHILLDWNDLDSDETTDEKEEMPIEDPFGTIVQQSNDTTTSLKLALCTTVTTQNDAGDGTSSAQEENRRIVNPPQEMIPPLPGIENGSISLHVRFDPNVEPPYPKPTYSYPSLIALALINSETRSLRVDGIYNFICLHFPYFRTAPIGWKNSIRHTLSHDGRFRKVQMPDGTTVKKGSLWEIEPTKMDRINRGLQKGLKNDTQGILNAKPEILQIISGIIS